LAEKSAGALCRLPGGSKLRHLKLFRHLLLRRKFMVISEAFPSAEATGRFAQKAFCELQQSILQHEAGAFAGDVEAIHDMRVGIRRLRVALGNFRVCVSKEDRIRLRAGLENLADALGGVRDLDVMIEALKSKLAHRPAKDRAAIGLFINRLRARRRRRHRQLVSYLQGQEYANFKREFVAGDSTKFAFGTVTADIEDFPNEQAA
jgi:CHAD domain-containing protein